MTNRDDEQLPVLPPAPTTRFARAKAARVAALEEREDRENERAARAALILAAIPLGVTQLVALLLSTVAAARFHPSGKPVAGADRARKARLLACVQLMLICSLGGWWLIYEGPRRHAEATRRNLDASRQNLTAIAIACRRFRDGAGRGQRYPSGWEELLAHGLIDRAQLRSPVDGRPGLSSYSYLGRMPMRVLPEEFVLAYETYDDHRVERDSGHLVVFADARVEWISNGRLQALIRTQRRGPTR